MKLLLASIAPRPGTGATKELLEGYIERLGGYVEVDLRLFRNEEEFFDRYARQRARTQPVTVLLDSRGRQFSSRAFAGWIGQQQDSGRQRLLFGVGPADGWSDRARGQASLLLSLGPMTLPHELARIVLAEQLYRAFTILSGHPYHCGHGT